MPELQAQTDPLDLMMEVVEAVAGLAALARVVMVQMAPSQVVAVGEAEPLATDIVLAAEAMVLLVLSVFGAGSNDLRNS